MNNTLSNFSFRVSSFWSDVFTTYCFYTQTGIIQEVMKASFLHTFAVKVECNEKHANFFYLHSLYRFYTTWENLAHERFFAYLNFTDVVLKLIIRNNSLVSCNIKADDQNIRLLLWRMESINTSKKNVFLIWREKFHKKKIIVFRQEEKKLICE